MLQVLSMLYRLFRNLPRPLRPLAVSLHDFIEGRNRFNVPREDIRPDLQRNVRVVATRRDLLSLLPRGGVVAECGVDRGCFSEMILTVNQPHKLYLIDQWGSSRYSKSIKAGVQEQFSDQLAAGSVEICEGTSFEEIRKFPENYFDWVYIDTNHQFQTTCDELAACAERVKQDGFIVGHDYTIGNFDDGIRYGVIEAVNKFCNKEEWELIYLTNEAHRHISFAIRRAAAAPAE